jgi:hypothetical protein
MGSSKLANLSSAVQKKLKKKERAWQLCPSKPDPSFVCPYPIAQ